MNRKASLSGDSIRIILILAGIAVVGLVLTVVLNQAMTPILDLLPAGDTKDAFQTATDGYPGMIDFLFIIFLVGLPLISLVSAYINFIPSWFYWISIALNFVLVLFGVLITYVWEPFTTDELFSAAIAAMPAIDFVMSNMHIYAAFVFLLVGFGTYVRSQRASRALGGFV